MKGKLNVNDSIMNYIKKAVIISLFTALAVMIRPCIARAEIKGDFTVTGDTSHYSYDDGTKLLSIHGDCTVQNTDLNTVTTTGHIEITSGCTVTLAGVNIESYSTAPIWINPTYNGDTVTLKLSRTNKVTATGILYAGIEKDGNNSGSLIITSEDNGVLNATGKYDAAGIGGGKHEIGGNITINGGNVTATSFAGAGIGGGAHGSGSNITISGGKVIAKSTGQTYHGSAIGKGYNGVDQSGNSITPSSTNPVNIWQNTENESDTKTYSDYTSSLDISSWTNQILMIIFDKIDVVSSNSSSSCNHHYEWEVEREPTETQEGELVYKCSLCGDITAREPISSYEYYLYKCMGKIRDAKAGDTVTFSSKCWNSYPKAFFEKLAERRDITVKIQFTYEHKDYEITIAPGQTVDTSSDYYGPLKLMELYGASD